MALPARISQGSLGGRYALPMREVVVDGPPPHLEVEFLMRPVIGPEAVLEVVMIPVAPLQERLLDHESVFVNHETGIWGC